MAVETLQAYAAAGFTTFDTADIYGRCVCTCACVRESVCVCVCVCVCMLCALYLLGSFVKEMCQYVGRSESLLGKLRSLGVTPVIHTKFVTREVSLALALAISVAFFRFLSLSFAFQHANASERVRAVAFVFSHSPPVTHTMLMTWEASLERRERESTFRENSMCAHRVTNPSQPYQCGRGYMYICLCEIYTYIYIQIILNICYRSICTQSVTNASY